MTVLTHPRLEDVSLSTALHALADPTRLDMVRRLAMSGELCCEGALASCQAPKSTRSHHLKLLRAAGLIRTRKAGREYLNVLRRAEFDSRFPGLLATVLAVAEPE